MVPRRRQIHWNMEPSLTHLYSILIASKSPWRLQYGSGNSYSGDRFPAHVVILDCGHGGGDGIAVHSVLVVLGGIYIGNTIFEN